MKKKYVITIIISIILLLALIFFLFWPAKFEFSKGKTIELAYGEKYQEPGYKVTKFGKNYTKNVKIAKHINLKKLGTYEITYKVKINGITFEDKRKVKIVDKEKPLIKLTGNENVTICPNAEYQEEGYKATDNYDGDITEKVKITKKDGKIIYSVKDSSGNQTKITRKVTKEDKTLPEITLNGKKTNTIYLGNTWKEPGYKATDNCDNDITNNVVVEGSVNTNKIGKYKITYTVKDSSGNQTITERTVNVIKKPSLPSTSNGKKGVIYLTFDDGPNEGTTNVILDILKEENVKATFFVTNKGPDNLIKREYDEGHTVALHTASHDYASVYKSVNDYYNDLFQVQNRVKRITGVESKIIRFPGGSSNTISKKYSKGIMTTLTKDALNKGYRYYDWNIDSDDAGGTNTSSGVYNNVVKYLSKNRSNMILMHDIKPHTKDALRSIIRYGKNNGYTFEKITMSTPMITHHVNNWNQRNA